MWQDEALRAPKCLFGCSKLISDDDQGNCWQSKLGFFQAADYKAAIGFNATLLLEPKPQVQSLLSVAVHPPRNPAIGFYQVPWATAVRSIEGSAAQLSLSAKYFEVKWEAIQPCILFFLGYLLLMMRKFGVYKGWGLSMKMHSD